jgi:hypothetical protein
VRPGDLDAAGDAEVVEAPVQQRRGYHADVHDVHAALGQPAHESFAQLGAARTVVAADGDGARHAALHDVGSVGAADGARRLDGEVLPHDAADVVLPEDAGRDRHGSLK